MLEAVTDGQYLLRLLDLDVGISGAAKLLADLDRMEREGKEAWEFGFNRVDVYVNFSERSAAIFDSLDSSDAEPYRLSLSSLREHLASP